MALGQIAYVQSANDDVVGALLTAARIENPEQSAMALKEVVRGRADAGDLASAFGMATQIQVPTERDWALLIVGGAFVRAGRLPEALDVAESIGQKSVRAWLASHAAAAARDVQGALQLAVSIDDLAHRGGALGDIARAVTDGGDVIGGLRIADSIEDVVRRSLARADVARAQADAGNFSGAWRTVTDSIPPGLTGAGVSLLLEPAVIDIAVEQARADGATGAVRSAMEFLRESALAVALARIGAAISSSP